MMNDSKCTLKNRMIKVRFFCKQIPSIPEYYYFVKEGHILEFSSNLVDLYKRCLRMGYDIRYAETEIIYFDYIFDTETKRFKKIFSNTPDIKRKIDQTLFERKSMKLLRDYEYKHKKKGELT